ncbi:MAG: MFS transporter [Chthonomonas sp.]|nr:MFS transporter [Chthonomonas sp.]
MTTPTERLRTTFHVALSSYWFTTHMLWGVLMTYTVAVIVKATASANPAQLTGNILGIGSIAAIVVPLLVGPMSDRCLSHLGRRRPFMLTGTIMSIVGLAGIGFAAHQLSIPLLVLGYLITNLGNNIATAAYSGLIPDLVPMDQRGTASGFMAALSQLGTLLGLIAGAFLGKVHQVPMLMALLAVILGLSLVATMTMVKETAITEAPPAIPPSKMLASLWEPMKHNDFRWVWITRALVVMGFYCIQPFLIFFSADVLRGSDPSKTTLLLGASVIVCASVSGLVGGMLGDRHGRKRIVIWANSLMAIICVGFAIATTVPTAIVAAAIFGLAYGAYYSVDWALGSDVLPNHADAGKDMAVWHIAMTLPQAVAAPLAGQMIAAFGSTQVQRGGEMVTSYPHAGYVTLFLVAGLFTGAGAVLLRKVRGST